MCFSILLFCEKLLSRQIIQIITNELRLSSGTMSLTCLILNRGMPKMPIIKDAMLALYVQYIFFLPVPIYYVQK